MGLKKGVLMEEIDPKEYCDKQCELCSEEIFIKCQEKE